MTRTELAKLVDIFLATRQKHGLDIAVEAVAEAAIETFMAVSPAVPESDATVAAVKQLIQETCWARNVEWRLVMSHGDGSRNAEVCRVRRECMARIQAMGFSESAVGRLMGRDHSTAHAALKVFRAENPSLAAALVVKDELAERRESRAA